MLDDGHARYFDVKCLGRMGPGFPADTEGFVGHGDSAKVGQFITLMGIAGCRSSATGNGRRDVDQELEGSAMKLAQWACGLIMYISMDKPVLECVCGYQNEYGVQRQRLGRRL